MVSGELPTQRPVAQSFDISFDLRLNKRLSKQSCGWWFETLSLSLWRHSNAQVQPLKHKAFNLMNYTTRHSARCRKISSTILNDVNWSTCYMESTIAVAIENMSTFIVSQHCACWGRAECTTSNDVRTSAGTVMALFRSPKFTGPARVWINVSTPAHLCMNILLPNVAARPHCKHWHNIIVVRII